MFVRRFLAIVYCSFLIQLSTISQAAEDNHVIREERQGKLNPRKSKITDVNFWEKDGENSWYIAINYLSTAKKMDPSIYKEDKAFLKCIAASFLRINYRLEDSANLTMQGGIIRDYEPTIASLTDKRFLPIQELWLDALPEIEGDFSRQTEGLMLTKNSRSPARFLTMLPSSYQGTTLWVGGERNDDNPHTDKFIINIDKTMKPDMLADGTTEHTFAIFPDNKFKEVNF